MKIRGPPSKSSIDQATLSAEIALSGCEQNGDLTGKNLRLLAGPVRAGPTLKVRAFHKVGGDFVSAGSVPEPAAQINQLASEHLIDGEARREVMPAPISRCAAGSEKPAGRGNHRGVAIPR
jgi:predicted oxidoreductase